MPVVRRHEAVRFELHGAAFTSFASPSRGSSELCAWLLEVPAGTVGAAHSVTREEVLHVLEGELVVSLGDECSRLAPGDVAVVGPGEVLQVDNCSTAPARAWVTTSAGLEAVLPDGTRLSPPWAR
ncbi:Cupin domain-containing protein [Motilibacter peucedani]|uniref:Cupin domain-containing protein n=1 Tax=Motilibacter peucedani TaxID=598650 RepID=A0A420XQW3_9ACTN|nr:cupin domain-containing protein [Motilibacter peucedani]RKS75635.1 Cupin domain-containing protein [Motilibacter peucedani]